ncbi:hypothetical protein L596_022121 [Steinernema carpocapsae]|uniref:RING-type domain-containing protein n=1 Tax=Steinernema carpocapsae TaxID=34508 RepID=A0A4U5ML62_STECR|nr:hypothetical protein L596_022121 [Steinernema carpocapsae]
MSSSSFARFNCQICLDWLSESSETSSLLCGHVFHAACISHLIPEDPRCPSCRIPIQVDQIRRSFFSCAAFDQSRLQDDLDLAYRTISHLESLVRELTEEIEGAEEEDEEYEPRTLDYEHNEEGSEEEAYSGEETIEIEAGGMIHRLPISTEIKLTVTRDGAVVKRVILDAFGTSRETETASEDLSQESTPRAEESGEGPSAAKKSREEYSSRASESSSSSFRTPRRKIAMRRVRSLHF